MTYETILYEVAGEIATVTLNTANELNGYKCVQSGCLIGKGLSIKRRQTELAIKIFCD
jgi:hypothetical protein